MLFSFLVWILVFGCGGYVVWVFASLVWLVGCWLGCFWMVLL